MSSNPPAPALEVATLTFHRHIAAPPEAVAAAIVSPHGLRTWLCDDGRVEKRAGGRLAFYWHDGRQAFGRWTVYDAPTHLAWRWRSEEDDWTTVSFELAGDAAGTEISVTHAGVPTGDQIKWRRAWEISLDALDVYVRTGQNDRLLRRPMLGVTPKFNSEEAAHLVPGVLMGSPVDDGGAAKAGLLAGDRLLKIGDNPVNAYEEVGPSLDSYRAGDVVPVVVGRGDAEHTLDVTLGGRPQPAFAETADAIVEQLTTQAAAWFQKLDTSIAGLSEAQAEHPPADGEWSVKQNLAHLIVGERFGHEWLARLKGDEQPLDWSFAYDTAIDHFGRQPLAQLVATLRADVDQSIAMTRTMLDAQPRPPLFRELASSAYWSGEHLNEHSEQIGKTVEVAREALP